MNFVCRKGDNLNRVHGHPVIFIPVVLLVVSTLPK